MVYGGEQKPGATTGARAHGPRRGRRPGTGPGLPRSAGRRSSGVYGLAGLAVLALWGAWSLGVVGCSGPGSGYGRIEESPGSLFANMRQSPEEISRLERNAHYYKLMGQPELGLKEMELAHQQNPDNLQITDLLAQNYEELGKFEAARQLYQEALTRHGPNAVLANNLCFSYYQEGRWQEAETCFRQTLAHDPGNVAARNNLGLLYCRLGRQDEARRLWQEAEGVAAADAKMSQALAALGMPERAVYARKARTRSSCGQGNPSPNAENGRLPVACPYSSPSLTPRLNRSPLKCPRTVGHQTSGAGASSGRRQPAAGGPEAGCHSPEGPCGRSAGASPPGGASTPSGPPDRRRTGGHGHRGQKRHPDQGSGPPDPVSAPPGRVHGGQDRQSRGFRRGQDHNLLSARGGKNCPGAGRTVFPPAGLEPSLKLDKGMDIKVLLGHDLLENPQFMARLNDGAPQLRPPRPIPPRPRRNGPPPATRNLR